MEATRLSTKGQIILPKAFRNARAWEPGTGFTVDEIADGILLRPASRFPATTLDDVIGCLRSTRKLPTKSQVRAAIDSEVMRRRDSGRY